MGFRFKLSKYFSSARSHSVFLSLVLLVCISAHGCTSSSKIPAPPATVSSSTETSGFTDQLRSGLEKLIGREDDPEVLKVLVGGDVMFNWGIRDTIRVKGELAPVQGLKSIFEEVDLRMLNLETPVVSEKSWDLGKSYVFQAKDKDLDSLSYLGVDLVFLGNNHAMDHGSDGIAETRKFLKDRGISFIGAGKNLDEALGPWSLEKKGTRLTVYSATNVAETRENYASDKPGVLYFEPSLILPNLKKDPPIVPEKSGKKGRRFRKVRAVPPLRKTTPLDPGFRMVSLHWGVEYSPLPTKEQRDQARLLLENGVQVIVGHHPHIPQGIERIGRGIVFYSLGNLIFGSRNTYLNHNLIAILHIKKGNYSERNLCRFSENSKRKFIKSGLWKGKRLECF